MAKDVSKPAKSAKKNSNSDITKSIDIQIGDQAKSLLLPNTVIETRHWRLVSWVKTAAQYGGDWWGWSEIPRKDKPPLLLLLIGDATGHGAAAALVAATVRGALSVISSWALRDPALISDPREVLRLLNRAVYDAARGSIVMTLSAIVFDPVSQVVRTSNAGHNFPYIVAPVSTGGTELKAVGEGGVPLGHSPETEYAGIDTYSWTSGSKLFLYTDGLTECYLKDKNLFDRRALQKCLKRLGHLDAQELLKEMLQERKQLTLGASVKDDVTVIICEMKD